MKAGLPPVTKLGPKTESDGRGVDESPEIILGDIPAAARLDLGSERLRLFMTTTRLIIAHVGKRGAGALAASPILGKMSGTMEGLLKVGQESRKGKSLVTLTPEKLLAIKDNFFISHDDIVRVELNDLGGAVDIMILTKASKFQLVTLAESQLVAGLFQPVADKLIIRRIP